MFCFYAFGISRQSKDAFRILGSYSGGILLSNLFIGSIISTIGGLLLIRLDPLISNQIGALFMIGAGLYLLIQLFRKKINPHSKQSEEIVKEFQENGNKHRARTGFLLGLFAGLSPCLFEIAVFTFAAGIGIMNGLLLIAFYAIGTLVGMFPYALFGMHRIKKGKPCFQINRFSIKKVSKIEVVSVILLLIIGLVLFSFAFAGINIFRNIPSSL
jgi:cytochrome c biogenesis protein CcdA